MDNATKLTLNAKEAESVANFINLHEDSIEIITDNITGIGWNTYVQVEGKPSTRVDITDYTTW